MNKRFLFLSIFVLFAMVLSFSIACAQEEAPKKGEMPEMTPEQLAAMAAWQKYATPSETHKEFEKAVGTWNAEIKMWEKPDAPPTVAPGTAINELIFDGRYLLTKFESVVMGMPFKGMNITGFDNAKKVYNNLWIDNMSTGFYLSTGTCNKETKTCTYKGIGYDPITNKDYKTRDTMKIIDDNKHVMEMYWTGDDGNEFKMMEITYTRAK